MRTDGAALPRVDALRVEAVAMLAAWARVWSPMLEREQKEGSWQALGLPSPIDEVEAECWRLFHAGMPAPAVPLLLHCLAGMDGSRAREDWLRAIHHLDLAWEDRVVAPDHLAVACEVLAAAVENDDGVLVRELLARYVKPWCEAATQRLATSDSPAAALVACFAADVATIPR